VAEKLVLACLLHDIGIAGFIRGDHGYWAAQLLEPYVDEEVSWAIRYHQALRFFPDESVGYAYPQMYIKLFGADYEPDPYIQRDFHRPRRRAAGRRPGHGGSDSPHAAPAQLRRWRSLVLAAGRGRLGARPDQHGPRPRRRNVHRQPRQPRAADRRARVRARVG